MPEIEFFPETRSALLPVDVKLRHVLRRRMEADGFSLKDEFHMTVLPAVAPDEIDPHEVEAYREILDGEHVGDVTFIPRSLFRIKKPKRIGEQEFPRESIIVLAHSERVTQLLSRKTLGLYGLVPPRQFPHVTLATKRRNPYELRGIGVDSWMDFSQMDPQSYPPKP